VKEKEVVSADDGFITVGKKKVEKEEVKPYSRGGDREYHGPKKYYPKREEGEGGDSRPHGGYKPKGDSYNSKRGGKPAPSHVEKQYVPKA